MNTFISKITASVLALSLTLISSASLASSCGGHNAVNKTKTADVHKATKAKPVNQSKKAPSFLFVIDAKQGEIKKDKNGQFHLVLKHADVNHVIMFSDRPNRIVKTITGKDLQKLWPVGKNSFEKDPPNAVLSGSGIKTQIVILNGIHVTKDTVRLPISVSSNEATTIGAVVSEIKAYGVTLVIDHGYWISCNQAMQCEKVPRPY